MGIKGQTDLFRQFSIALLFNLFWKSGLTANQISILNFFTLGLGSVILFIFGLNELGLLTAGLAAMVDYIDGTVARAGRGGKNGAYIDTSLDWLWLMLLIGAISYSHNIMTIGYITLIAITFGNWVQYNGRQDLKLKFPFGTSHLLVLGILSNRADLGITMIMFVQSIRTAIMYWRSLWSSS